MNTKEKNSSRKFLLSAAFIVCLILTIIFHQQASKVDKEALGTEVDVKVTEIKTKSTGLNPGALSVTVSYKGETYKLHGVPASAHFAMKNSKAYHSTISARLYDGKMYYDAASIHLLSDTLYYAFLAPTYFIFIFMVYKVVYKNRQG